MIPKNSVYIRRTLDGKITFDVDCIDLPFDITEWYNLYFHNPDIYLLPFSVEIYIKYKQYPDQGIVYAIYRESFLLWFFCIYLNIIEFISLKNK